MSKKNNKFTHQLKRSTIARHTSDLVLSSVVALFLCGLINKFIDVETLSESIKHKPSANLMAAITDTNLRELTLSFQEIDSTIIQLGFFLALALGILIIYALLHLQLTRSEDKKTKEKTTEFQRYFTSIITENNKSSNFANPSKAHQRSHLSKTDLYDINNRAILLKELRSMHSLVGGKEKSRLEDQYYALGFVDELEDKFQSPDWVERAQAINEVAQFKVSDYYSHIDKLLIDKNETVRQNALVAKIKLDDQPLKILSKIDRPLSVWEKHQMFLAIKALPSHKLPSFKNLIQEQTLHFGFIKDLEMHLNV